MTDHEAVVLVAKALKKGIKDGETLNWHYDSPQTSENGVKYTDECVEYDEHPNYGNNAPLFYCYRA